MLEAQLAVAEERFQERLRAHSAAVEEEKASDRHMERGTASGLRPFYGGSVTKRSGTCWSRRCLH